MLDFIGQANKKYRFEEKFAALLCNTNHSVGKEIKDGFTALPKGCYIQLEKVAASYILQNIKASYGSTSALATRLQTFTQDSGLAPTLENFLGYYNLDPRELYKTTTFTRLSTLANLQPDFSQSLEDEITKACAKFAVTNSRRWIQFLLQFLSSLEASNVQALLSSYSEVQKLMLQMMCITIWGQSSELWTHSDVVSHLSELATNKLMVSELVALLRYQFKRIDFIDRPVNLGFNCPLDLHCTYSRDQLLTALGYNKPSTIREGVKWLKDKKIDVFMITLNKSNKDYSPTTMYNDYSINETLFHWQSQSTTSETSETGQRYIHHVKQGSRVLLFVREFKTDNISGLAEAYTFLGPATYVKHEGSRPMNITWRLEYPITAKFLKKTNKLLIG